MKLKVCPSCGCLKLGDRWTAGRMLQQYCNDPMDNDCRWVGKPRTPERKKITAFKDLRVDDFYGWNYITYDKYGHTACHSRSYGTEAEAEKAMKDDMTRTNATDPSRPYTGVLFFTPATVKLKGKMFKEVNGTIVKAKK